uniref:Uncharacterized protein n=1 Tax=Romanomermis culicivorax TaxID=13658 RepID=A0A915HYS6_ROMCU
MDRFAIWRKSDDFEITLILNNQIPKKLAAKCKHLNPGSYFCSLLGEHARRACSELYSEMFGEHRIEQAARRASSAREYLLVEQNTEHKKFVR